MPRSDPEKLAQALRDNLRRRKPRKAAVAAARPATQPPAPKPVPPKPRQA